MQQTLLALVRNNDTNQPLSKPDATPYIMALLEADGRVPLAAERLKLSVGEFLYNIASDPEAQTTIERALRIFTTIKLFESLGEANIVMKHNISNLEPMESSKTFTNICELIERATRTTGNETNINIFDTAMRMVPPEVRTALEVMAQQRAKDKDMVIDHSDTDE